MRSFSLTLALLLAGAGLWLTRTGPAPAGAPPPAEESRAGSGARRAPSDPGPAPGLASPAGSWEPSARQEPADVVAPTDRAVDLETLGFELASSDAGRRQEAVRRLSASTRPGARILLARLAARLPDGAEREAVKRALAHTRRTRDRPDR